MTDVAEQDRANDERDAWQNGLESVEMTRQQLHDLLEYSTTLPTGKTLGKRWKRRLFAGPMVGAWVLGEYVADPEPGYVGIRWRVIQVTDAVQPSRPASTPEPTS